MDLYHFYKGIVRPVSWLLWRPRLLGEHNIPNEGGVILAPNHVSWSDTFLLPVNIRRRVTFGAKKELFEHDGQLGRWFLALFLKTVGMVPIDRSSGRGAMEGVKPLVNAVKKGQIISIFPEGTRSPDGRLYKGHTGIARMVAETGAPVVPVGNIRTQFVKGKFGIPTMRRPMIIVGKPLDFSEFGPNPTAAQLRWMTDEIMAAIQSLTGQRYVNVFASRVKVGDLQGVDVSDRVQLRPGGGPAPKGRP